MAGMDPKILAAVFASIAAIAAGTGGSGTFDNFQDIKPEDMIGQFTESPSDIISGLREKPEPDNPVKITAVLNDGSHSLDVETENMRLEEFSKIISNSRNISSDESINFQNFKGKLRFGKDNLTQFDGSVNGFQSSGVSISEQIEMSAAVDADIVKLRDLEEEVIALNKVDVRISSLNDSTVIERESTSLDINSFSGNITLDNPDNSLELEGSVDKVKAGGTSFSG